jgi:hypothetical protein
VRAGALGIDPGTAPLARPSSSAHSNAAPSYDWSNVATMRRTTEDITDRWDSVCAWERNDCFMGIEQILDVQGPLASWAGHVNASPACRRSTSP